MPMIPLARARSCIALSMIICGRGTGAAGRDDARLRAQCPVLEPLGAAGRRDPPRLSPGPARRWRVRSAAFGLSLHAGGNRGAGHRGARRARSRTGALGRQVVGRDHRRPARRRASRTHRQPRPVQYAGPHLERDQAHLRARSESASAAMRAYGVGEWCRQTLGYRLDLEQADRVCRNGSSPRWTAPTGYRRRDARLFEGVDTQPLLAGISVPVLLLCGEKSRIAAATAARAGRTSAAGPPRLDRGLRARREPAAARALRPRFP